MNNLDKIKGISIQASQMMLIGMCEYINYAKVKSYLDKDDFLQEDYKRGFMAIQNIYDNYSYKNIDSDVIDIYAKEKNLDSDSVNLLKGVLCLSERRKCSDFDGAFSTFRKNVGFLKMYNKIDEVGGFESFMGNLYSDSNNSEEVKATFDSLTRTSFRNYKTSSKAVDMGSGMLEFVKTRMFVKDGKTIDFIGMPLIQSYSKGIHIGMTGVLGHSGAGKTSVTIPLFSIPILENSETEKLLSIHNEQDEDEIRQLYLMSYITRVAKNKKHKTVYRENFNFMNQGKITREDMLALEKYAIEFENKYAGRLKFVFVPRFNEDDLEALILEHERLGYKNVVLDTFKTEDSMSGWEGMDNLSKRMDGIAKDLSLKIVYTAQLAGATAWRKYLDVTCIGKAKSLKDTATSLYMIRKLSAEEIPTIDCSYWVKDEVLGKSVWTHGIKLDPNKHYYAFFNDKQRKGQDGNVIIMQYDLGYLFFKEIGVTTSIKNDSGSR
jgi:hypothetical protein